MAASPNLPRDVHLHARIVPPVGPCAGVVDFVVGPEVGASEPYPRFAEALRGAGFGTVTVHPRGAGLSDGRRGDVDDFGLILGDLASGLARATEAFPKSPVFLFGHSAGGALALHLAATTRARLAGVVLVNPAFRLVYGAGMGPSLADRVRFAFDAVFRRSVPTVDLNANPAAIGDPDDRAEALAMRDDPTVVHRFSLRHLLGQRRVMMACARNAARVTAPLLLVEGARDALVDRRGNDEILAAAGSADATRLVAEDGAHGATSVETVVEPLLAWLVRHATQRPGKEPRP